MRQNAFVDGARPRSPLRELIALSCIWRRERSGKVKERARERKG